MLIVDEYISEIEVWRLREWKIAVRQIGPDLGRTSAADENLISILHRLKNPSFFTRDQDFWNPKLCHARYCLIYLDIPEHEGEIAAAIRACLRHRRFNTHGKRMGKVVRIHFNAIHFWEVGKSELESVEWE